MEGDSVVIGVVECVWSDGSVGSYHFLLYTVEFLCHGSWFCYVSF